MPEDQKGGMPGGDAGQEDLARTGRPGDAGTRRQGDGDQTPKTPASFEEWLKGQDEAVRTLYEAHTQGLRNTVQATRQERDGLSQQLGQLQAALGKNPEEAKRLVEQMTHDLEAANRRAAFVEEAVRAEIGCSNPKAAYALAQTENLFDRRGNPDWTAIKAAAPELFGSGRSSGTPGHAGAGTQGAMQATGMNEFIRRAAGRG